MTIHDILQDISDKSDADATNLWHSINHQIQEENLMRKSKNRRLRLSVTWAMALLGILVMSSAIFGRNQRKIYHAVTITEIERMAVPLNLVETNNDLTIQMDWAYADATQIVIAYTTFDMDGEPMLDSEFHDYSQIEIKHLYEYRTFFSSFPQTVIQNPDSAQQVVRFSIRGTYFETLNELLEQDFDINEYGFMDIQLNFFHNPPHIQYTPSHSFEFEIPFGLSDFEQHNDFIGEMYTWDTSEVVSEIEMYFNDLVITPSLTQAYICGRFPDDVQQSFYIPSDVLIYADNRLIETVHNHYHSDMSVNYEETHIPYDANYFINSENPAGICIQFKWHLAFDELPQTIRIEIPEFYAGIHHEPDDPMSQSYFELYAEEGYQLEYIYNEEYDYTDIVYPPELEALSFEDRRRIDEGVREALNELYPLDARFSVGWEYEFELNPETE